MGGGNKVADALTWGVNQGMVICKPIHFGDAITNNQIALKLSIKSQTAQRHAP